MNSMKEGLAKDASSHSLSFRVMRLCKPSLQVDLPLKCDFSDMHYGEDDMHLNSANEKLKEQNTFSSRCELEETLEAFGMNGMMVLPQSFGSIYIGETFSTYVSIENHSNHEVSDVVFKAELQTEKRRSTLIDQSKSPVDFFPSKSRKDFILENDIKELGLHTLVCYAIYYDNFEQKQLLQYFKFTSSNPISVKTKVRTVKNATFVEACIENNTKSKISIDNVKFDASNQWESISLNTKNSNLKSNLLSDSNLSYYSNQKSHILKPSGGSCNFLFQLTQTKSNHVKSGQSQSQSGQLSKPSHESSNVLGKFEIEWKSTMGGSGKLQTQSILGNPLLQKEIELKIINLPSLIQINQPFTIRYQIHNHSDLEMGPFRIFSNLLDSKSDENGELFCPILFFGFSDLILPKVKMGMSFEFSICFFAQALGVHPLPKMFIEDVRDLKPYDSTLTTQVYIQN